MQNKRVKLQLKSIDDAGTFTGLASVFGNRDMGGDVMVRGAFTKSIAENGGKFPLLDEHGVNVGVAIVEETHEGLKTKGLFNLDVSSAKDLYSNMKFYHDQGMHYGMSIGYKSIPSKTELKHGSRYLKEVRLFEITCTVIPMNDAARVGEVKSGVMFVECKADFSTELEAAQTWAMRYQIISALDTALAGLLWDDKLTPEQKVEAAAESIDQFRATCLEHLPKLLALMQSRYKSGVAEIEQKQGREIFSAQRIDAAEKSLRALLGAAQPPRTEPVPHHSALTAAVDRLQLLLAPRA